VEFLIRVRNGEPSKVGYVASGFWAGLTLGRLLLADFTHRLGERRMVFVYIILAIITQLIFTFVPNIIANAVMISLFGFFIGPFFPTVLPPPFVSSSVWLKKIGYLCGDQGPS